MTDPELLERLAAEELLNEAKRGAARASLSGPSGWQKCPLPKTNKKFLNNTLLHTLSSNRLRKKESKKYDGYNSHVDKESVKAFVQENELHRNPRLEKGGQQRISYPSVKHAVHELQTEKQSAHSLTSSVEQPAMPDFKSCHARQSL